MAWQVDLYPDFMHEAKGFALEVRMGLETSIKLLQEFGPALKRPYADTLNGSTRKDFTKRLSRRPTTGLMNIS